jgi:hypothetical protein
LAVNYKELTMLGVPVPWAIHKNKRKYFLISPSLLSAFFFSLLGLLRYNSQLRFPWPLLSWRRQDSDDTTVPTQLRLDPAIAAATGSRLWWPCHGRSRCAPTLTPPPHLQCNADDEPHTAQAWLGATQDMFEHSEVDLVWVKLGRWGSIWSANEREEAALNTRRDEQRARKERRTGGRWWNVGVSWIICLLVKPN